ncbi:phosphatase PAP2 family protein [Streptomyces sp. NPDC052773]|uniref:phosphatase PAP2 family protein n=1 Tax=Streptomyces sp. NPDC052773 TaxID=3365693 RepID=UPI0037D7044E
MHTGSVDSPPRPPQHRRTVRAGTGLALCSLLLIALVAAEWGPLLSFDGDVARTTHRWALDASDLTQACRILTDWVWDPNTMRILCGVTAVALVWRFRAWWTALWLVVTVALGTALQQSVKAAVDRARPVWPDPVDSAHYAAFPSGHAMSAAVVCGLLLWLLRRHGVRAALWRTAVTVAAVSVLGVGLTRVWLGVHWPTDVLGGWLLGATWATLAVAVHQRMRP